MVQPRKLYPAFWYRDSVKVLTAIAALVENQSVASQTLREAGGTGVAGEISKIRETCIRLITEELNNAPKTFNVPAKTEAQLPMDPPGD